MDWEALAAIAAFALAVGTAVGVVWRGGRMAERIEGHAAGLERHEKQTADALARHEERLDDHAEELKRGVATFATLTTKVDQILGQQDRMIATLEKLARKDN